MTLTLPRAAVLYVSRHPLLPLLATLVLTLAAAARPSHALASETPAATREMDRPFQLLDATIRDIQRAILGGEITAVELVELYLTRIAAFNGTCVHEPEGVLGPITTIPSAGQINALQTLNLRPTVREAWGFDDRKARSLTDPEDGDPAMPDALEVARILDAHVRETGSLAGPLHGVVLAIKDQYDTYDMRTTSGADAFYANDRPPEDATFVDRLRAAGAIILAKSNLGEFASAIPRSAFGGTFCNPYDTERSPGGSSAGSGSAVAANLVTCSIAEETGSSIRDPAASGSTVGISPTQELVSRHGMIQQGINTRVGPICRTVEDAARILSVIAGYDPRDELTAFAVGRIPQQPYEAFAAPGRLEGLRIGVVREYMDLERFTPADEEAIRLVSAAAGELAALGATVVDPGPGGALFDGCVARYQPLLYDRQFTSAHPDRFPRSDTGEPVGNHIEALIELSLNPTRVPEEVGFRTLQGAPAPGQGTYWLDRYLRERGDANIRSTSDLIAKANFYEDPNFPDHRERHENNLADRELDMAARMQERFAVQTLVLQCMAEQKLDAVIYPTSNLPPARLGAPRGPVINGRPADGVWRFLGRNGFPAITVPVGFTTQVYDRVRLDTVAAEEGDQGGQELATELRGPFPLELPMGMDIVARPFDEPTLIRIAAAFEAATRHRRPPLAFGALEGEP